MVAGRGVSSLKFSLIGMCKTLVDGGDVGSPCLKNRPDRARRKNCQQSTLDPRLETGPGPLVAQPHERGRGVLRAPQHDLRPFDDREVDGADGAVQIDEEYDRHVLE